MTAVATRAETVGVASREPSAGATAAWGEDCFIMDVADEESITGKYPELAKRMREIVGKASLRVVARRSGISHWTVHAVLSGDRIQPNGLVQIARTYHVNPNDLLSLADYPTEPIYDLEFRLSQLPPDPEPERTAQAVRLFEDWYDQEFRKKA